MKVRVCKYDGCGNKFEITGPSNANRKYCCKECSKNATSKRVKQWNEQNRTAGKEREYRQRYLAKNQGLDAERKRLERQEILAALGGACIVCGVTKASWLHVDYIPTCRGLQYRHPRGKSYVLNNISDFRILCANHHYELTLTGNIEGTDISQ